MFFSLKKSIYRHSGQCLKKRDEKAITGVISIHRMRSWDSTNTEFLQRVHRGSCPRWRPSCDPFPWCPPTQIWCACVSMQTHMRVCVHVWCQEQHYRTSSVALRKSLQAFLISIEFRFVCFMLNEPANVVTAAVFFGPKTRNRNHPGARLRHFFKVTCFKSRCLLLQS